MAKSTILIVGNSFHTLRDYLLEHDFEYVVLKDKRLAKHPEKRLKRRVVCDFNDQDEILAAVDQIARKSHITGVMATYENYILDAARIAAHLRLPGLPIETAQACTDKYLMRQKFMAAPEKISPDFAVITSENDIRTFASQHSFPLILKPANLSKSLLVFKNHNLEELLKNYRQMTGTIADVYAKYAPHTTPKILIEEFMEGSVHSVDAFIDDAGTPHVLEQVVDYQTGYDIGYDDNFHYSRILPSALDPEAITAIHHIAALGCRALGMKSSPAHIEIIMTKDGPRIVEIGARNGGYRDRMHGLANGIDVTGNALAVALGAQPNIQASRNDSMGVFELFPHQAGIFDGIEHESELRALSSFNYFSLKATPGNFVGKSSEGFKMCAIVILYNPDPERFAQDVAYLNNHVRVLTR